MTTTLTIDELREAAAQAQTAREQAMAREAAEKEAEKVREAEQQRDAFIEAAENIFREELGITVRIPPDQVIDWHESHHKYAWRIPGGPALGTRNWRGAGSTPASIGLTAWSPIQKHIRTLADLADAFANAERAREHAQAKAEEEAERKREQDAQAQRRADLEANEPAAPPPQTIIDDDTFDGLHLAPHSAYLGLEAFHAATGQIGPAWITSADSDQAHTLLAALMVTQPVTVQMDSSERVAVRYLTVDGVTVTELLWMGWHADDARAVFQQRLGADAVAALKEALGFWLAYRAAYEAWRDELSQIGADEYLF